MLCLFIVVSITVANKHTFLYIFKCLKYAYIEKNIYLFFMPVSISESADAHCAALSWHGNIPAEDNEEIRSLPLSSAFQTAS